MDDKDLTPIEMLQQLIDAQEPILNKPYGHVNKHDRQILDNFERVLNHLRLALEDLHRQKAMSERDYPDEQ